MRFGEDKLYCSCTVIWKGEHYHPVNEKISSFEVVNDPLLKVERSSDVLYTAHTREMLLFVKQNLFRYDRKKVLCKKIRRFCKRENDVLTLSAGFSSSDL